MLDLGSLAVAAARRLSIVFDKFYTQSNLIRLVIEFVLGVILVL